nr:hypothetical protein [Tanacetum cinerariifolium]
MVAEDDETSKDKEIDKLMALISLSFKKIYKPTNNNLRTSSNTSRANQDNSLRINRSAGYENQRIGNVAGARETVGSTATQKSRIQCYNCKEFGHVARECQKPKRVKDATYHREKMLLCKQEEAGIQLNAEQADWRDDTNDDELEDQELEAHYMYMAQLQEVSPDAADSGPIFDAEPLQKVSNDDHYNVFTMEIEHPEQSESVPDTYLIEQDAHNVIIDSLDMSYDREKIYQNDDDNDLANERELLAPLIEKLKCEINESKNRNKFLKTSNKVLIEKLKGEIEDFKNKNKSLESSNNRFKEANNKPSETNNLLYTDFKKSQAELARRNSMEYASKVEIDCAKAIGDLMSYKMESQKSAGYENQRIANVAGARETIGSTMMQKYGIQCYNCKEFGHVARECQKPKRVKDASYHRERMLFCKQEEAGIQLNAEQADWRDDTNDDELEDQELEAHYMYMAQLQEVSPDAADSGPIFDAEPLQKVSNDDHYNVFTMEIEHPEQSESVPDTYLIEQDAHNVIIDSLDMSYDREKIYQNDDDNDLANERELLA